MKWIKYLVSFLSADEVREFIGWLLDFLADDDDNDMDNREVELMKKRIELSKKK